MTIDFATPLHPKPGHLYRRHDTYGFIFVVRNEMVTPSSPRYQKHHAGICLCDLGPKSIRGGTVGLYTLQDWERMNPVEWLPESLEQEAAEECLTNFLSTTTISLGDSPVTKHWISTYPYHVPEIEVVLDKIRERGLTSSVQWHKEAGLVAIAMAGQRKLPLPKEWNAADVLCDLIKSYQSALKHVAEIEMMRKPSPRR